MAAKKAADALLLAMDSQVFKDKVDEMLKTMLEVALQELEKNMDEKLQQSMEKGQQEVRELKSENESLKNALSKCEDLIMGLVNKVDELEQYSRKNCLIISGVPKSDRHTQDIVMDIAAKMNIQESITGRDIDNSHWMGDRIIVKFATYNARRKFFEKRKTAGNGIFVSENLTKKRNELLFNCRKLKRENKLLAAWTNDGQIKIKLPNGTNQAIKSLQEVLNLVN